MNFELRSNYLTMTKNKDKKHVEQPVENQVEKETVETVNNSEEVNDTEAAGVEEVSETDPLQAKVAELEARVAELEDLNQLLPLITRAKYRHPSRSSDLQKAIDYADMVVSYVGDGSGTHDMIQKATDQLKKEMGE